MVTRETRIKEIVESIKFPCIDYRDMGVITEVDVNQLRSLANQLSFEINKIDGLLSEEERLKQIVDEMNEELN